MHRWLPDWAWTLLFRHFLGRKARPAVRWMNRFAFLGLVVGVFAWTAVVSIMNGLQGNMKQQILREKAHLMWEGQPVVGIQSKEAALRKALGDELRAVRFLLQTEGQLVVADREERGRVSGAAASGVVIQGVEGLGN